MPDLIVLRRRVLLEMGVEEGEPIRLIADLPLGSGDGALALRTMRSWSWDRLIVLLKAAF